MQPALIEYENTLTAMFRGKRLASVRYYEIQYDDPEPCYQQPPFPGHTLDFGCDLSFTDGSTAGIIWDGQFFQYGVGVYDAPLSAHLSQPRVWEVSSLAPWSELCGLCIVDVKLYCTWAQYQGQERQYFPQDLALTFENEASVYFSAAQYYREKDVLSGMSDDIAVVFSEADARKYGLGPYADVLD